MYTFICTGVCAPVFTGLQRPDVCVRQLLQAFSTSKAILNHVYRGMQVKEDTLGDQRLQIPAGAGVLESRGRAVYTLKH